MSLHLIKNSLAKVERRVIELKASESFSETKEWRTMKEIGRVMERITNCVRSIQQQDGEGKL